MAPVLLYPIQEVLGVRRHNTYDGESCDVILFKEVPEHDYQEPRLCLGIVFDAPGHVVVLGDNGLRSDLNLMEALLMSKWYGGTFEPALRDVLRQCDEGGRVWPPLESKP